MSRWFRDYLYVPLGGSRGSGMRTVRNVFITMFLAGLWHGAAWPFVVFGLSQGVLLGAHGFARSRGWSSPPVAVGRVFTYLSFVVTLTIFRAPTLESGARMLKSMAGLEGVHIEHLAAPIATSTAAIPLLFMAQIAAMLLWVNMAPNSFEYRPRPNMRTAIVLGLLLGACIMVLNEPSPFLYFQF